MRHFLHTSAGRKKTCKISRHFLFKFAEWLTILRHTCRFTHSLWHGNHLFDGARAAAGYVHWVNWINYNSVLPNAIMKMRESTLTSQSRSQKSAVYSQSTNHRRGLHPAKAMTIIGALPIYEAAYYISSRKITRWIILRTSTEEPERCHITYVETRQKKAKAKVIADVGENRSE